MFAKRNNKKITFIDSNPIGTPSEYYPIPARKVIPEWYKEIEAYVEGKKMPRLGEPTPATIKKCMPVFDAMTAGYLMLSHCDVHVTYVDGEPFFNSALPNQIQFHARKQAYNHPLANDYVYPKWINAFGIKTPPGFSTLFINPMHRKNDLFTIFEGIVDTDDFRACINFPFVLTTSQKEFIIPAGTPLAQVIPFKRDEWKMEISPNYEEILHVENYLRSEFFDRYKRKLWKSKNFL